MIYSIDNYKLTTVKYFKGCNAVQCVHAEHYLFYSERKHSTGFVLAAFKTTKLTASKEIAATMKNAKTNTPTLIGVR